MRLSDQQLACIYAKDIAMVRKFSKIIPEAVSKIVLNVPSAQEITYIVTNRTQKSKFRTHELFNSGLLNIQAELGNIRDALLTKDGLVDASEQDLFRNELRQTFNNYLGHNQSHQNFKTIEDSSAQFSSIDRLITALFRDMATNETLVELRR